MEVPGGGRRCEVPVRGQEENIAGVAQLVERQPSKLNVAGSNPVSRSRVERQMRDCGAGT